MKRVPLGQRRRLYLWLTLVLTVGFIAISLVSYNASRSTIHDSIVSNQLPLTSDNIYSEIQKDLIRPVLISSLMAGDTFFRDWVIRGERDHEEMRRYLKEIMGRHGTFTAFFVSEATRNYYHADSLLKQVREGEARDRWYFRVREMKTPYEINLDPDLANRDALTIFINYRVFDYEGRFIGATGVGLTADAVQKRIDAYQQRYQRRIHFADTRGRITISNDAEYRGKDLRSLEGLSQIADDIFRAGQFTHQYRRGGNDVLLNARYIPELHWYLLVEQDENPALAGIRQSLYLNILIVILIAATSIWLTGLTIQRYQHELEDMAVTDKLTGLANRQAFAPLVEQLEADLKRNPAPLCVILADIDRFKLINDSCGHQTGDQVLARTARALVRGVRDSDLIFRWGGEEFLIVLRDCRMDDAGRIAEKVRADIDAERDPDPQAPAHVTMSFGVAALKVGESIEELIGRADQALYAAKAAGRNRCHCAEA